MARTFILGFEGNDTGTSMPSGRHVDGVPSGTGISLDTGTVRSGTYSLKANLTTSVAGRFLPNQNIGTGSYVRGYVRVTSLPGTARIFFGDTTGVNLKLNTSGTLELLNTTTSIGTSTTALTDSTRWYRIEVRLADGSSVAVLRIDGNDEVTGSPSSWSMNLSFGDNGANAGAYTVFYDDVTVDDTTWPGDGKVVLLLPASDNTVTNWTAGAGSTSNLWDAVNNTPPTAVASASETNTTNIESASSTGTATYIANMTTYSTAGLVAADTVNAIMQVVVHGEDIVTGTKTGTYEMTQNPVVASTAFTTGFGGDAGAHGAYNNASSFWVVARKITATPSITVGTTPLMKLVKTDTTTRVGCVCFMGIYVDYTPAVVSDFPVLPHRNGSPLYKM